MNEQEKPGGDRGRALNLVLAGVATLVAGLAVGWAVQGTAGTGADTTLLGSIPPTTAPMVPGTTTLPNPPITDVPGEITFVATNDTYLNSDDPAEINGLEDEIEVEDDPPDLKRGLISFEVEGIPEGEMIRSATLRLYSINQSDDAIAVHLAEGGWTQIEANEQNAPGLGDHVATIPGPIPDQQYVEVDLTAVVVAPGRYDFYLLPSGSDTAEFASIENQESPLPTLVVRWLDDTTASRSPLATDSALAQSSRF